MKKRACFPILLFSLSFLFAFISCWLINNAFPVLHSGAQLPGDYEGEMVTLAGFEETAEAYRFTLHGQGLPPALDLLIASTYQTPVRLGRERISTPARVSQNERIYAYTLEQGCYLIQGEGWTLNIYFAKDARLTGISLCDPHRADRLITTFNIISPLSTGMFLLMTLYSFSLYVCKRSEKYLLLMGLSSLMLFCWGASSNLIMAYRVDSWPVRLLFNCSYEFSILFSVAACYSFCEISLAKPLRFLGKWYGLLALGVLFTVIDRNLPSMGRELIRFSIYMIGCFAVIAASAKSDQKPWLPLCGLGLSQGMRMVALLPEFTGFQISIFLITIKLMRVFILLFVLSCMFYINRKFARKFSEAEALSLALEDSNRALDQKVEARTRELTEQQRIKNNLMTNIFHDLRSPLFVMRGCMDGMRREAACEGENMRIMDEQLRFITGLAEDLFLVAKLEDKRLLMETEPVPLGPLLLRTVEACRVQAEAKGVGIHCHIQERPCAWGDELWLGRALQNLIDNAVYYTPPGGQAVRVLLGVRDGEIFIEVRDQGVGIAPEDMDKIFQRYYRVSGQDKHQSSGLGLSIVQGVIEGHGGRIGVESWVGQGTAFTLFLPLWSMEEG